VYRPSFAKSLWLLLPVLSLTLALVPLSADAQETPSVSLGAGLRTSFVHDEPDGADRSDTFLLDSIRLYVGGTASESIHFMFNTEYDGGSNEVQIMDAAAQITLSESSQIWFGRFLPPSDRANLYGPYYAHHWGVYSDGIQDGYPFAFAGRDNGAMYLGQFDKVKVAGGVFDGSSATGDDTVLTAGRLQLDFWDAEPGYYQNATYYGEKNLLAVGLAFQAQGTDKAAFTADFLLEQAVGDGGAYTVEAEWARYDALGGYDGDYGLSDGGYVLGAYLFPSLSGPGRFEVLAKYARARFREGVSIVDFDYDQDTTEVNLNYLMQQFNARFMIFFKDTRFSAVRSNFFQFGVGLQIQM